MTADGGEAIVGDTDASIDFLKHWAPLGLWVLSSDEKPGALATRTFSPDQETAARTWIGARQGKHNIYFSPNQPRGRVSKKTSKLDIGEVVTLHVDFDPRKDHDLQQERERILRELESYTIKPSVVTDSGGGYWAFWRLAMPQEIPAPSEGARRAWEAANKRQKPDPEDAADLAAYEKMVAVIEAPSRAIARAFGADNCFNIDRVARLPGTVNVPSEKKMREKGQRRALARVVWADWDRLHSPDNFPRAATEETQVAPPKSSSLDATVQRRKPAEWCEKIINDPLCNPDGKHDYKGHRARAAAAICCELARCGWPDEEIAAVLNDPTNGINEHVRKQKPSERYVAKTIAWARLAIATDFVRDTKSAIIANSQHNIGIALARMGVEVSRDPFADRLLIEGPDGAASRHLDDAAMTRLWLTVDERFGFRPTKDFYFDVVTDLARQNERHPVREYFDRCEQEWDGTERLDGWLKSYGGAEDSPYVRAVGRLMLIAAVRRIRQPGVKFDEMPVLESPQGMEKSTALEILAVDPDWFTDNLPLNASDKEVIEILSGRLIVEAGELKGMRRGDVEHLKAFLSRRIDRARMSYGRLVTEVPRQCVIVGTTNSERYLRDSTGNRRFWPVRVGRFDTAALLRDRDQLWGEAARAETRGESIRLDRALWPLAAEQQEGREIDDPWVAIIESAFDDHLGVPKEGETHTGKISTEHAWLIVNVKPEHRTQDHNARLGEAMRKLGWERTKARTDGRLRWVYARGDADQRKTTIVASRDQETGALAIWNTTDDPPDGGGRQAQHHDRNRDATDADDGAENAAEKGPPPGWEAARPPLGDVLQGKLEPVGSGEPPRDVPAPGPNLEPLIFWMRERENIRIKKERGDTPPWTCDPILATRRFCNVRRSDDKVTRWLVANISEPYAEHPNLWFMLCCARYINWPDTLAELIATPGAWPDSDTFSPAAMGAALDARMGRKEKTWTGAYMIRAEQDKSKPWFSWSKQRYVAEIVLGNLWEARAEFEALFAQPNVSLREAHAKLKGFYAWGDFMAYQALIDIQYTRLLASAPDRDNWAAAGPGTIRGLNRLHKRRIEIVLDQVRALREMREVYAAVRRELPEIALGFADVGNILCECDKWLRVQNGEGELRARYSPASGSEP